MQIRLSAHNLSRCISKILFFFANLCLGCIPGKSPIFSVTAQPTVFNELCQTFLWTQGLTRIISEEANPLHADRRRPEAVCCSSRSKFTPKISAPKSATKKVSSAFHATNSNKTPSASKSKVFVKALGGTCSHSW